MVRTVNNSSTLMTRLFPHFTSDVSQPLLSIEALGFKTTISEHFYDLGIFLTVFSEDKLSLIVIVLVFPTSPIFSSLFEAGKSVYLESDCKVEQTFPLFYCRTLAGALSVSYKSTFGIVG